METFAKNLAKTAAKSAVKHAMGQTSSEKRSRDGVRSSNQINPEDFRGVAEFVLGMLGSKSEQPKRDDDRKKDKKRKRDKDKDKDRSRDVPRSRDVGGDGDKYGSDKERRKRRRHRVTFAEPYYDPRQEEQEAYYQPPYEPRHRDYNEPVDEDKEERRRRRRQRRYRRDLDLKTLKTELEAMSSTIISLNARGAQHRDCEFYDRFVRKGGRLQDVIGSTLGQIRGLQEGDDEAGEETEEGQETGEAIDGGDLFHLLLLGVVDLLLVVFCKHVIKQSSRMHGVTTKNMHSVWVGIIHFRPLLSCRSLIKHCFVPA